MLEISRILEEEELYYPCSINKITDQLRNYCEADLRLCVLAQAKFWFSHGLAQLMLMKSSVKRD